MKDKKTIEIIFDIIMVMIVIALYFFAGLYLYSNFRERKRNEVSNKIIDRVDEQIKENNNTNNNDNAKATETKVSYAGYNYTAIGKIRIRKIGIYQPILKENTKDSYNASVVKMSGPDLNTKGNVAIGGHNFMKGNFFIKINRLVKDDIVEITDLFGKTIKYYVYEYGIVSADDASYLKQPDNEDDMIITLVTCTKGGKERYIVKAKAR